MPLLDVRDLTVRFGGLAAVRGLSFGVERGQIVSLIGPNGAGKTTVFNAITGVHPPTDGRVLVLGRELARPLTWQVRLAGLLVGLLTGLAALLLSVDANLLWRATIRKNMLLAPGAPLNENGFRWSAAGDDLLGYLNGELAVEPRRRGWAVVSPHLNRELGQAANEEDARILRSHLEDRLGAAAIDANVAADSRWRVAINSDLLARLAFMRRYMRVAPLVGFTVGFLLGVTGSYAIWRRSRRTPDVIARRGLARTFQNIRLFRDMTALENVLVALDGAQVRPHADAPIASQTKSSRAGQFVEARAHLAGFGLAEKANRLAASLAYGDQRRLEIARALATSPDIVLLDEPAAGMNPTETRQLTDLIAGIRDRGVTVLLIEHHMNVVMSISDRVVVLNYGGQIAAGTPAEIRNHDAVIEAYLGKDGSA